MNVQVATSACRMVQHSVMGSYELLGLLVNDVKTAGLGLHSTFMYSPTQNRCCKSFKSGIMKMSINKIPLCVVFFILLQVSV